SRSPFFGSKPVVSVSRMISRAMGGSMRRFALAVQTAEAPAERRSPPLGGVSGEARRGGLAGSPPDISEQTAALRRGPPSGRYAACLPPRGGRSNPLKPTSAPPAPRRPAPARRRRTAATQPSRLG